jgi:tungstate transport system substrate-binding protein
MGLRHRNTVLLVAAAGLACVAGGSAAADSAPVAAAVYGSSGPVLRLATGSPGELGLVGELAVRFSDQEPIRLEWHKAGSGAALELLKQGRVDLVMVHAPAAETAAVAEGWAARRTPIGGNAYYLVGPTDDPAGIRASADALDALRRIASTGSRFLSRGDQSGTHRRELALWAEAGISPDWPGYSESSDFMAASLRRAEAEGAYFLTDNSTWVALQNELPGLERLYSGDPRLLNAYHALLAPDGPSAALADRFLRFLEGPDGQAVVRDFGRAQFGAPLYLDAAALQREP